MKRRAGNGIESATGYPSWCRPLRPLFHFLDDVSYPQSVLKCCNRVKKPQKVLSQHYHTVLTQSQHLFNDVSGLAHHCGVEAHIQSRPLVWSTDVRSTRLYGQFLAGPERNGHLYSNKAPLKVRKPLQSPLVWSNLRIGHPKMR